ncbi:MAG: peptidoglycan DD-metalloendopeptidase family protein [Bacteroidales bacterium]|nr:peptidoglycan DD-metalloendopeptidase family protein [Bacteroidales bacterium]
MKIKVNKYFYVLFLILCCTPYYMHAQNTNSSLQDDKRTKNRRIADSLYYVHTLKKQEDSLKQSALKDINTDTKTEKKKQKNMKLSVDTVNTNVKVTVVDNKIPSRTLYQNTWFSERVKSQKISLNDIPDEVMLRLCGKKGEENFCFPYKGIKTSGYGWRWGRAHTGLDIALKTGDKIYAAFDGVVRVAKFNGGYGNMVLIRHYNNLETLYGHMSEIKVKPGQEVKAGDVIGLGGSTGHSTGPHLHFECRLLYACFDPEWIVDMKNYKLKTKFVRIDKSYFGIPASQAANDKKEKITKLAKVDKLLDGTKYVSPKELDKMILDKQMQRDKPVTVNNEDRSTWRYYKIKDKDTLETISEKYNIRISDLIEINNITDNNLKVGERIRVR